MSEPPRCESCGAISTHAPYRCCWCFVVEDAGAPIPIHPECVLAAKRIAPIQVRFRTAIRAEREGCLHVLEHLNAPFERMPEKTRAMIRRNPETGVRACLDLLVRHACARIRERG